MIPKKDQHHLGLYVGDQRLTCLGCMKKTWACICCSPIACEIGISIATWKGIEGLLLSTIQCAGASWTMCAPCCFRCRCGDRNIIYTKIMKSIRYFLFGCCMLFASPFQGLYNCCRVCEQTCFQQSLQPNDLYQHTHTVSDCMMQCCALELTREPLKSMDAAIQ